MKITATLILIFSIINSNAQVFTGTGGAISNNGVPTNFTVSVSGLGQSQLDNNFGVETVCIDISHSHLEELNIYLLSPSGMKVELTNGSSVSGSNYTSTCFNSSQSASFTLSTAPYTGTFKPLGYLGRFNNGQLSNGTWTLIVKDWLAVVDSGSLNSWSIQFGNSPSAPVQLTSSNLPLVFINTHGQEIGDTAIVADMGVIDNGASRNYVTDAYNNYNGKIKIHVRGHSSANYEKNSFSVETDDAFGNDVNVALLGMPGESDWVLGAEYADKTLIRNPLTYHLSNEMGHYASRTRKVEVILNNEYYGVYTFGEKIKRNVNRVNIAKITTTDNTFPGVTGGYIVQIDRTDAMGWYSQQPGVNTSNHFYYQYVYPKDSSITDAQKTYIKAVLDSFETAMHSGNIGDSVTGYPHFIDLNSFVDQLIINELSKDVDGYRLSSHLYKDKISSGGKLHAGPVWDYDLGWHNANYGNANSTSGWEYNTTDNSFPMPEWWVKLRQDSVFNNVLSCRWTNFRQTILSTQNINAYIDSAVAELSESAPRNFTQWPILATYIWPNPQNEQSATYQTEVEDLKNWIAARASWIDSQIPATCLVSVDELSTAVILPPYPNPFSSSFNINYRLDGNANVKVEMYNLVGERVALLFSGHKQEGSYTERISTPAISAGMYMLKVSVDNNVYLQKMVKAED